jgi:hypothetical protein
VEELLFPSVEPPPEDPPAEDAAALGIEAERIIRKQQKMAIATVRPVIHRFDRPCRENPVPRFDTVFGVLDGRLALEWSVRRVLRGSPDK